MKKLLSLSLFLFTACVSSGPTRLQEPIRTSNYATCILRVGLPVTTCQCIEEKLFKKFKTQDEVLEKGYGNFKVLKPIIDQCLAEVMPEIERNVNGEDM